MELDPNVQVALVSVFATLITTFGIIAVAVINNRKERSNAAEAGVEAGLDEKDVLTRMLSLISENERKEKSLIKCREENRRLKDENRLLRIESTMLRLGDKKTTTSVEDEEEDA